MCMNKEIAKMAESLDTVRAYTQLLFAKCIYQMKHNMKQKLAGKWKLNLICKK